MCTESAEVNHVLFCILCCLSNKISSDVCLYRINGSKSHWKNGEHQERMEMCWTFVRCLFSLTKYQYVSPNFTCIEKYIEICHYNIVISTQYSVYYLTCQFVTIFLAFGFFSLENGNIKHRKRQISETSNIFRNHVIRNV